MKKGPPPDRRKSGKGSKSTTVGGSSRGANTRRPGQGSGRPAGPRVGAEEGPGRSGAARRGGGGGRGDARRGDGRDGGSSRSGPPSGRGGRSGGGRGAENAGRAGGSGGRGGARGGAPREFEPRGGAQRGAGGRSGGGRGGDFAPREGGRGPREATPRGGRSFGDPRVAAPRRPEESAFDQQPRRSDGVFAQERPAREGGRPERPQRFERGEPAEGPRRRPDAVPREFDRGLEDANREAEPREELIWGRRTVMEYLRKGAPVQRIYISMDGGGMTREFFELAKELAIPVVRSGGERLDAMTRRANHQGVVATLGERSFGTWEDIEAAVGEQTLLLLALDGVQDPGNFGALLRTAEGAGVQGVVVGAARSCPLSATVSKTSAGADAHLVVARVEKLDRLLGELAEADVQIVGTDAQAEQAYWDVDWTRPTVLVLGAEGEGMSPGVARRCTVRVRIPMLGKIESLNVGASGAAILYEAVRQRQLS
jgi:23S rRNA (guanosine2251-2'-O)-methyltransferase